MTDVTVVGPTPILSDPPAKVTPATLTPAVVTNVPASVAIADATIQLPAKVDVGDTVTVMVGTAKIKLLGPLPVVPPPTTGWASKPAFGSYPAGTQTNIVAPTTTQYPSKVIEIAGKTFRGNIGTSNAAIRLQYIPAGWKVWIHDCDFDSLTWHAIDALASTGVQFIVEWCRFFEITKNCVQFDSFAAMSGSTIRDCKILGGKTEDDISIYSSGGVSAADPFIVERVAFQGTDWTSGSGSGLMHDGTGTAHTIIRNCTMLDPGQVGIGIPTGADIHLQSNVLYAHPKDAAGTGTSNVGIYCYVAGSDISGNRIYWLNGAGQPNPTYITVAVTSSPPNVLQDVTIDPNSLVVTL